MLSIPTVQLEEGSKKNGDIIYSSITTTTPSFAQFHSISMNVDMDTIVVFDKEGSNHRFLIYNSLLELRGDIHLQTGSVVDCSITKYGIFILHHTTTSKQGVITKYNSCGDYQNELFIPSDMYSYFWTVITRLCGITTGNNELLVIATESGEYLFVDAVQNTILTRIPEAQRAHQLLVNESTTGLVSISRNADESKIAFYQLNNCISPVFYTV